jgi:hypothetical protein
MMKHFDRIVIGAGIYGLYAAVTSLSKGFSVLILEREKDAFTKATSVNQARIHNGLHYPRSLQTASQCCKFYNRFIADHRECIKDDYDAIYAVSAYNSKTSVKEYIDMMNELNIQYEEIDPAPLFKPDSVTGVFRTREASFDYSMLQSHYMDLLNLYEDKVEVRFNYDVTQIRYSDDCYIINNEFATPFVLNATYASVNQVASLLGLGSIDVKYELCEVVLCTVSELFKHKGITVMDGDYFSIMPWGYSGLHSLTSVHNTPHCDSRSAFPDFDCIKQSGSLCCGGSGLRICSDCKCKPYTAFDYMRSLVKSYLPDSIELDYKYSLFTVKAILKSAENDDSRPTVIKSYKRFPGFYTVLAGKISTVYELDAIL